MIYGNLDIWIYGYMGIWIYGYMDIWIYGYMDIWIYGHMDIWIYGSMDIWTSGYMDIWTYGYMDTWIYGYMGLWISLYYTVLKTLFGVSRWVHICFILCSIPVHICFILFSYFCVSLVWGPCPYRSLCKCKYCGSSLPAGSAVGQAQGGIARPRHHGDRD